MAAKKKKKNKKNKQNLKFLRNILIGVVSMLVVAFIINIAPGYRRDKYADVTNLVITDENVTEHLKHIIYINEKGTIYLSKDDMSELIDKTIYYDESTDTIITTSDTCTASMKIGEKILNINGADIITLDTVIYLDDIMYIPISELESVYNISVKYIKDTDIVVIDNLNQGMITANLSENTKLKFRPRGFSKKVDELQEGEKVYAFYTTSKGWRLIRTEDGKIGYVKANTLTNEYIVRQDMEIKKEAKNIELNLQSNEIQQVYSDKILVKDLLTISNEGITIKEAMLEEKEENTKLWANLSNNGELSLDNYNQRLDLINNIVSLAYKYNLDGININFTGNVDNLNRFVIELAPRLYEMGISTNIVINENIDQTNYTEIVDYIITSK